jgi:hypothetical protein
MKCASILLVAATVLCGVFAFADEKSFSYVDLKEYVNYKPGDPNGDDDRNGNDLPVPTGEQTMEGVKLLIGERVIQLGSKVFEGKPEKVEGIKVGRKFARLHILHATAYGGGPNTVGTPWFVEDDTLIGEYRVNYEDKSSEGIPIEFGKDVRDWWFREDETETSRSKVAWKGDNELAKQNSCRLRVYLSTWKNPKPDQKVVSIDFIGRKDQTVAAPFCLAMTVEEK